MQSQTKDGAGGAIRSILNLIRFTKRKKSKGDKSGLASVQGASEAPPKFAAEPPPVDGGQATTGYVWPQDNKDAGPQPPVAVKVKEQQTTDAGQVDVSPMAGGPLDSSQKDITSPANLLAALESTPANPDAPSSSARLSYQVNAHDLSGALFANLTRTQSHAGMQPVPARLAEGNASGMPSGETPPLRGQFAPYGTTTTVGPLASAATYTIAMSMQDGADGGNSAPLYSVPNNLQEMLYADYDALDRMQQGQVPGWPGGGGGRQGLGTDGRLSLGIAAGRRDYPYLHGSPRPPSHLGPLASAAGSPSNGGQPLAADLGLGHHEVGPGGQQAATLTATGASSRLVGSPRVGLVGPEAAAERLVPGGLAGTSALQAAAGKVVVGDPHGTRSAPLVKVSYALPSPRDPVADRQALLQYGSDAEPQQIPPPQQQQYHSTEPLAAAAAAADVPWEADPARRRPQLPSDPPPERPEQLHHHHHHQLSPPRQQQQHPGPQQLSPQPQSLQHSSLTRQGLEGMQAEGVSPSSGLLPPPSGPASPHPTRTQPDPHAGIHSATAVPGRLPSPQGGVAVAVTTAGDAPLAGSPPRDGGAGAGAGGGPSGAAAAVGRSGVEVAWAASAVPGVPSASQPQGNVGRAGSGRGGEASTAALAQPFSTAAATATAASTRPPLTTPSAALSAPAAAAGPGGQPAPLSRPMKLTTTCLAAYTTLYDNGGDQSFHRALQRKMQSVYNWLQASDLSAPPDPWLEVPPPVTATGTTATAGAPSPQALQSPGAPGGGGKAAVMRTGADAATSGGVEVSGSGGLDRAVLAGKRSQELGSAAEREGGRVAAAGTHGTTAGATAGVGASSNNTAGSWLPPSHSQPPQPQQLPQPRAPGSGYPGSRNPPPQPPQAPQLGSSPLKQQQQAEAPQQQQQQYHHQPPQPPHNPHQPMGRSHPSPADPPPPPQRSATTANPQRNPAADGAGPDDALAAVQYRNTASSSGAGVVASAGAGDVLAGYHDSHLQPPLRRLRAPLDPSVVSGASATAAVMVGTTGSGGQPEPEAALLQHSLSELYGSVQQGPTTADAVPQRVLAGSDEAISAAAAVVAAEAGGTAGAPMQGGPPPGVELAGSGTAHHRGHNTMMTYPPASAGARSMGGAAGLGGETDMLASASAAASAPPICRPSHPHVRQQMPSLPPLAPQHYPQHPLHGGAHPQHSSSAAPPPPLRTKTIAVASHCPPDLQPLPSPQAAAAVAAAPDGAVAAADGGPASGGGPTSPSPPAAASAASSWSINDFSLLKKLYEGSLSVVCQAQHKRSGRHVALKIYKRSRLHEMERFQLAREICLHIRIIHPHVVALFAAWKDSKYVYLALDWAPQGNMFDFLVSRGGRLGEEEAVRLVMRPLLSALAFLHSQHFIHRDIKLENLLLDASFNLKLADFGLAIDQKFEQANTRLGTFGYFAPEVLDCPLKKGPFDLKDTSVPGYDSRVDVWSAGVVGYEVLTGRAPFSASSPSKIIQAIRSRVLEFPGVSEEGRDFLRAALTRDPAARPTAKQLLAHPWILRHCGPPAAAPAAADSPRIAPSLPYMTPEEAGVAAAAAAQFAGSPRPPPPPPSAAVAAATHAGAVVSGSGGCALAAGAGSGGPVAILPPWMTSPQFGAPGAPPAGAATAAAAVTAAAATAAVAEAGAGLDGRMGGEDDGGKEEGEDDCGRHGVANGGGDTAAPASLAAGAAVAAGGC